MSSETVERQSSAPDLTTVEVRCTGHVRRVVGEPSLSYTFEGDTLRDFLDAFFQEYDVGDMLIAETEADATTEGWAPEMAELPGDWAKNPEGEQTRCYARVAVNGEFNEHLDGLDTELEAGDRIGLLYPFIFCC
ncbi:MoaD/ThiS family protein [Haloarcula sp. CBA1127]|uniref:MoaD/ThiS family protein n=1 Tax=Haloarcula sp. CBA1127 TaxID=1765055 RepID=UPI00073EF1D9|nr:MoaD/ThiS family protein [Haloarcula sp. CBA1127]